jgi:AcrR family transcriptional regulator
MPKQTFLNLPEQKRNTITNAAIDEFADYGFEAASINRIVVNGGISKGSFYQYFEDKMDVFRYLLDVVANEKTEFFKGKPPPSLGQSVFGYFRWMIKTGMEFNTTNPKLVKAIGRVLLGEGMYYGKMFADIKKKTMDTLIGLIQNAKQNGEIDTSVDEKVAATVMDTWSNVISNSILEEGMRKKDILKWVRTPKTQKYINDMLSIMEHGLRNAKSSSLDDE